MKIIIISSECVALLVEILLSASSQWWIRPTPESANKLEYNTNLANLRLIKLIVWLE